ncbi:MAG: nuclear transport factor 2 family protein, partial [Proteobacteria bacterium]|nr:nuclear transport factor 2 family protein [Pseudomonadota bacterium]
MPQIDEQKLYNAVARDEIYQLVCTYMRGQDRLDAETQRSVFWDDAWLSYGIYEGGPDGFVDFAQGALKNF